MATFTAGSAVLKLNKKCKQDKKIKKVMAPKSKLEANKIRRIVITFILCSCLVLLIMFYDVDLQYHAETIILETLHKLTQRQQK